MRRFAAVKLERVPDETTILNFRRLPERHKLGEARFAEINAHPAQQGVRLREGTIVDATVIAASSSTENAGDARDPEMHQTRERRELALQHETAHRGGRRRG